jgi:hypothetical protein
MALSDQIFGQNLRTLSSTAGTFGAAGASDLGAASNFFRTLLGGNRQAIMQQASPAVNQARQAADAAKNELASRGTARTGGTAAGNQQIEDAVRQQMDTLIGSQQAGAAGELEKIGGMDLQTMMQALDIGTKASQQDVQQRNQAKAALLGSLIGAGGSILGAGIKQGWFG